MLTTHTDLGSNLCTCRDVVRQGKYFRSSFCLEANTTKQWGEAYGEEKQSLYMVLHDDMALGTLSRNLTTGHNPFNRMFDRYELNST
jgi:hypothetical protein